MKACRGARGLGRAALLLGVVLGFARAADGDLRWAYSANNARRPQIVSSPCIGADGTVYFGVRFDTRPSAGRVVALDSAGKEKWRFDAPDWVDSSPALGADGSVYFGCWDGKLYALDRNGVKKWDYSAGIYVLSSPAVGADGTVYFGGGDSAVHAVSKEGNLKWRFPVEEAFVESSPAIGADGTVYFGSSKDLYALDGAGNLKWRRGTDGNVTSSPAIGRDGTIYVGSFDTRLYAFSADGESRWSFPTGGAISASPVLGADGTIYIGNHNRNFYAINPDGTMKWSISVGGAITSSAAVRSDGIIIFGADDGLLRAVYSTPAPGVTSGQIKWRGITADYVESSPGIAADGTVYVGSVDGSLYSYAGSGAPASSVSSWPMFRRDSLRSGTVAPGSGGGKLINLATRAQISDGAPLIAGLVTQGSRAKDYLMRAIGPTLGQFGVTSPLLDPNLEVKLLGSMDALWSNDDWGVGPNASLIATTSAIVGAFPLESTSKDAVVLGALPSGPYTAAVGSPSGLSGIALVEVYDAQVANGESRLINLSTRAHVGTGDRVLIPGLVVGGPGTVRLLLRAVGPGLTGFGVSGALVRPTMTLFSGQQPLLTNTGWSSGFERGDIEGAAVTVGAFPLAPGSADCAALATLQSGSYTLQVSGVGSTTGEALVEVYILP